MKKLQSRFQASWLLWRLKRTMPKPKDYLDRAQETLDNHWHEIEKHTDRKAISIKAILFCASAVLLLMWTWHFLYHHQASPHLDAQRSDTSGVRVPSRSLPAYWPLARSGHITSGFGERIDPIFHRKVEQHLGIDIGAPIGTPVLAAGDGTVEISGYSRSAGFRVEIDHKYGYRSVYYHLLKVTAHRGDHVHQGEVIGHVGNTGRSTGSHLHFGISYKNQFIDPLGILKAKG